MDHPLLSEWRFLETYLGETTFDMCGGKPMGIYSTSSFGKRHHALHVVTLKAIYFIVHFLASLIASAAHPANCERIFGRLHGHAGFNYRIT